MLHGGPIQFDPTFIILILAVLALGAVLALLVTAAPNWMVGARIGQDLATRRPEDRPERQWRRRGGFLGAVVGTPVSFATMWATSGITGSRDASILVGLVAGPAVLAGARAYLNRRPA